MRILFMSLTESFVPFVVTLESRDEIPKLDFVISMQEDFDRKHQSEESSKIGSDSTLFGMKKKSSVQGHRVPAQRERMKCFNCGKGGILSEIAEQRDIGAPYSIMQK